MLMVTEKPRQRAWKPKGRTGCKTCKIRKVKCDENRPHCKRCTSAGRPCDGYEPASKPSSSSTPSLSLEVSRDHTGYGDEILRSYLPPSLVPSIHLETIREYKSLEFFVKHASISLGGIVASPFWHRDVLRAAHWHPSIRHGLIALGAMYRRYFQGSTSSLLIDDSDEHLRFALQQCNQAIQALTESKSSDTETQSLDKITVIVCAVLFSSMACLQGHQGAALQHYRSGIRIMHELDREPHASLKEHPVGFESLRSVLISLDLQARSVLGSADSYSWEPVLRPTHWQPTPALEQSTASSPLEVHQYFEALYGQVLEFVQGAVNRPDQPEILVHNNYLILLTRFAAGTRMLNALSANTSQTAEPQSTQTIRLLRCMTEYFLRSPRTEAQSPFTFLHLRPGAPLNVATHFAKLLDLATRLLASTANNVPVFTPNNGPVSALWLIVMQAPSNCTALRRRAATLMQQYPRCEGMYDSLLAGRVSCDMLQWEQEITRAELGLGPAGPKDVDLEVPDHLRILSFKASYAQDDNRKAEIEYVNAETMEKGGRGHVKWLVW